MLPRNHPDRIHVAFDDHRLVNNAGLILPATLALHLGLPQLVDRHLDLGDAPGRRTEYLGRQVRGPIANGSGAETDITGALNPQFSCWLMGYPQEWVSCADSATP